MSTFMPVPTDSGEEMQDYSDQDKTHPVKSNNEDTIDQRPKGVKMYKLAQEKYPYKDKMALLEMLLFTMIENNHPDLEVPSSEDTNIVSPEIKKWIEEKLELYPKDSYLQLYHAIILYYAEEYKKSIEIMDKIKRMDFPFDNLIYLTKYRCYIRLKNNTKAQEYCSRLIIVEDDPELWRLRGIKYVLHGKTEKAIVEWQNLLKRYPWYSAAMLNIGYAKIEARQYKEALSYLDNALFEYNLEKTRQNGLLNMCQVEKDLISLKCYTEIMCGNLKNAINCFKMSIDKGVSNILLFDLILTQIDKHKMKENLPNVEEFYTFIINREPEFPHENYYQIGVYINKNNIEQALIKIREVFKKKLITPDAPNYYIFCKKAVEILERKFMRDKKVSQDEKEEVIFYLKEWSKYDQSVGEELEMFIALIRDRHAYPEVSYLGQIRFVNYTDGDLNHPAFAEEKKRVEEIKEIMKNEGRPWVIKDEDGSLH